MKEPKNTVQKGFRCDAQTSKELDEWMARKRLKNSQALAAILNVLKLSEKQEQVPGRRDEIDDFQNRLTQLSTAYLHSLQYGENAESRVRDELAAKITADETAMNVLKEKVDNLVQERDAAKKDVDILQKQAEGLNSTLAEKEALIKKQEEALADKSALVRQLQERWERDASAINETDKLKEDIAVLSKKLLEAKKTILELKQKNVDDVTQQLILKCNREHDIELTQKFWQK